MPSHSETRTLPYTARQMYDLVADVERYPEFLPWTAAARIVATAEHEHCTVMDTELVVSFKVFRESYTSRVTLWPEDLKIDTEYIAGPFEHMVSNWAFRDLDEGGCEVSFHTDFKFRNRILQRVASGAFQTAMQRIVRAFEKRAAQLYG